ncbi:hypothetical protein [Terrimonas pollutisoli]|uniref:hypothetical protein n=1 Tax=Terrimonas pollutisoli TaxID=3034147 RepID=UPI0023EB3196|nr:hypothetical protein [Terrimonas sp. H1YJ31]
MYTQIWNKYLPVIRILLKKSATEEQRLGLNRTDFEKGNRNRKPSCSFNVKVTNGRFNTVSQSAAAKELVAVLLEDEVTKKLLREHHYHFILNADLQLRIINDTPMPDPAATEENITNKEAEVVSQ